MKRLLSRFKSGSTKVESWYALRQELRVLQERADVWRKAKLEEAYAKTKEADELLDGIEIHEVGLGLDFVTEDRAAKSWKNDLDVVRAAEMKQYAAEMSLAAALQPLTWNDDTMVSPGAGLDVMMRARSVEDGRSNVDQARRDVEEVRAALLKLYPNLPDKLRAGWYSAA